MSNETSFIIKGSFLSYAQFSYAQFIVSGETVYELYIRIKTPLDDIWRSPFYGGVWHTNDGHASVPRWWTYGY